MNIIRKKVEFYEACNRICEIHWSAFIVKQDDEREKIYIVVQQAVFEPPSYFGNHIASTDALISQIKNQHFNAISSNSIKFFFRHKRIDFYPAGEKLWLEDFFGNVDFHEVVIDRNLKSRDIKPASIKQIAALNDLFKTAQKSGDREAGLHD
jgi:hypothetical protein